MFDQRYGISTAPTCDVHMFVCNLKVREVQPSPATGLPLLSLNQRWGQRNFSYTLPRSGECYDTALKVSFIKMYRSKCVYMVF